MEKSIEKASLDYKDGLLSIRIDCPGVYNDNNSINNSLSVYFFDKLLNLLSEKGFIQSNDAEDALFLLEDFLQNRESSVDFGDDFDIKFTEEDYGYL